MREGQMLFVSHGRRDRISSEGCVPESLCASGCIDGLPPVGQIRSPRRDIAAEKSIWAVDNLALDHTRVSSRSNSRLRATPLRTRTATGTSWQPRKQLECGGQQATAG